MLLSKRLPKFNSRMDKIASVLDAKATSAQLEENDVLLIERALLQIQIEWELFVRNLILDCATGQYMNHNGAIKSNLFSSLRSREAAAHKLISLYNRKQDEPKWYISKEAIDAAVKLDISNSATISSELGITPWPIDELRHLRNFIAHRSKKSALRLRREGIAHRTSSIDVLSYALDYAQNGDRRFQDWINFTKGVAKRITT